ncbi:hypothetical protein [Millisia brevis]|uniref:hypothetical protein n=1 Tax=Millisia brevis TaxID=264148 RepID=UPI001470B725|nr:hypothetical protein [Millisia brevis]
MLVAVSLVMAGCGSSGPSEQAGERNGTPTPTDVTFHNVWSAGEGIDLGSRSAELVRATAEAADMASLRGIAASYPGYESALASTEPRDKVGWQISGTYVPTGDGRNTWPSPPTSFQHLMDVSSSSDEVTGVVCTYSVLEEPRYNPSLEGGYTTTLIRLTRNDQPDGPVGTPDDDPSTALPEHRIPSWNVFEGWTIEQLYLDDNSSLHDEPRAGCARWMNQQFPDHIYNDAGLLVPSHTYSDNPPTMPMRPQYPEWIPPASTA